MASTIDRDPEPEMLLAELGEPLDPHAYDWASATDGPLTSEERFQLTYATQVEWGTEGTYQSLNITRDPVVRRFLRIWLEQEVVHADLLARFLAEHGVMVDPLHRTKEQQRAAGRGKIVNQLARRVVGDDFFAVHMSWGALNELTTLRFYRVIRARTGNELLGTLLRDIIAQEAAHYAFYRAAAIRRLDGNRRGQRIVRWTLRHLWSIVGSGLRGRADADRLLLGLLRDEDEVIAQTDRQIERIPGLEGLHLVQGKVVEARAA
jgi:rubrerythrin